MKQLRSGPPRARCARATGGRLRTWRARRSAARCPFGSRSREGRDEHLGFAVSLNRTASVQVSVDYASADGGRGPCGNLRHAGRRWGRVREDGERSHPRRRYRRGGIECFGGRFTGTPNTGIGLSDGGARDDRIGWRLTSAVPNDPGFEVHLDATRREPSGGTAPPEHGAIDTGCTNERCERDGASAAHAVGFARSGPSPGRVHGRARRDAPRGLLRRRGLGCGSSRACRLSLPRRRRGADWRERGSDRRQKRPPGQWRQGVC